MEKVQFKTNIKCGGCIEKVTPFLNETAGEGKWSVDTANPSKILTVESEKDASEIANAVSKAGFKAEKI